MMFVHYKRKVVARSILEIFNSVYVSLSDLYEAQDALDIDIGIFNFTVFEYFKDNYPAVNLVRRTDIGKFSNQERWIYDYETETEDLKRE